MDSLKMFGLANTALISNFGRLSRPYKLNFSITYWCQSRCLTCNIWQMKPKGELTIDEIREFAKRNNYFRWVELTGGEPFLRGDIVDIAKAFYENSKGLYMLTMPTNSLCDHDMVERKIRQILELGIPRIAITVSLDGYRELEDKIRGVPGNYDKAIDMFRRLQNLKKEYGNLEIFFGYTISKFNEGQLERTFEEVRRDIPELTRNSFHINVSQISSNYYSNSVLDIKPNSNILVEDLNNFIRERKGGLDPLQLVESIFLKKLLYYAQTGEPPMRSRSLDASLFMDSFGNLYPSIMWDKKVSNIREIDFDISRIWRSDYVNELRREIREGKEPKHWTACEAYQSIVGNIPGIF
ncbi:MAG: radical SAM protein [Candidatus Marsarchaeota archaeon]|nr:radical SAM protein [Candidatus Marsarchaeota archaeon]